MANFTAQQADACTFNRCESFKTDGVHDYWVVSMIDENGCSYEWREETLPGTADETAIKASVKATLLTLEMKTLPPVKSVVELDTIIGQTVGE